METKITLTARLEGFAHEQLSVGRGSWSIVHDLIRLGHVTEDEARAIVDRAWPAIQNQFIRRRRRFFWFGALLLGIPAAIPIAGVLTRFLYPDEVDRIGMTLPVLTGLMLHPFISFPGIIGIALVAYGWSGMRRPKVGATPGLPGSIQSGPVRTGLGWRAEPFEWK